MHSTMKAFVYHKVLYHGYVTLWVHRPERANDSKIRAGSRLPASVVIVDQGPCDEVVNGLCDTIRMSMGERQSANRS
jgi:hypothetical protein